MSAYQEHLGRYSDIREHLGLLHGLAASAQVQQVVELGFRTGVSASAFLAAGVKLASYDIDASCKPHVQRLARDYPETFSFKIGDSREVSIPSCDLLFIDTDHTYETTKIELDRHSPKVDTWIVLHDTVSFGRKDRPPGNGKGVMTAIEDFLFTIHPPDERDYGADWMQWLHLPNNNGLTLLKRR